jgi:hypothetical protein
VDAELVLGLRAYVDQYCERTAPGLWGEPLNAVSNLGFFITAWAIWRLTRRAGPATAGTVRWLLALSVAVGAGSTLFHLTAEAWSRTLDISLIVLFELVFFWRYLRAAVGMSAGVAAGVLVVFAAVVGYSLQFSGLLHGSVIYVPALAGMVGLGTLHRRGAPELLAAAGVFAVALVFRTLDTPICPAWPSGTHFVWHLLVAAVMYLSVRALIRAGRGA